MARCARIVLPGVPLHVVQRGNNRQCCFREESDRHYYLRCLSEYLPDSGCAIHAYALMGNHVHLLLTPATLDSVFLLMKPVAQKFAQYFNRKYDHIGTLWQGRYRSSIVETERYLLICHRYIEMNPVRAGIVREPKDYPWSSYHSNALGIEDRLLSPHRLYLELGASVRDRMEAYRKLFSNELSETQLDAIRIATNANGVLGGSDFTTYISGASGRHPNRRRRYAEAQVRP